MPKKIAIIGAAGYVGIELVTQLQNYNEYDIYTYTRDNGSFLLSGKRATNLTDDNINEYAPFDIVINLAYPTVPQAQSHPQINAAILGTIKKLAGDSAKIIHVSTQAVFGFGMDVPVKADFVSKRRDYAYIEAKLNMEHMVKDTFANRDVSIVRLGNVWGPGSGSWTASLAEKLLFGQYVNVEGVNGFANITDVKNVVSYLIHLVNDEKPSTGYNIYHLAEFSNTRWGTLVNLMAQELGVEPVLSDMSPNYSLSLKKDVTDVIKFNSIGDTYRKLIYGRFSGSYLRSLVRLLGTSKFQKIKKIESKHLPLKTRYLSNSDEIFLKVVTAETEFKSVTQANWTPALTFEGSWKEVTNWLHTAGYIS